MRLAVHLGVEHRSTRLSSTLLNEMPSDTIERIGGRAGIGRLIDGLYDRIEADSLLRRAFHSDLTRERAAQKRFFEGWFGGDRSYFLEGKHPGLRERHSSVSISLGMADRWIGHFMASLSDLGADQEFQELVQPIVSALAHSLVNRADEPLKGERLRGTCSTKDLMAVMAPLMDDSSDLLATAAREHPQALNKSSATLLLTAATRGKCLSISKLLNLGVDVNEPSIPPGAEAASLGLPRLRMTPLCGALFKKRTDAAELLLRNGALYDIFTACCLGDAEGVHAAIQGDRNIATVVDPASDVLAETPLSHAIGAGHADVASYLLETTKSLSRGDDGLLGLAAIANREDLVDLLLDYGADATQLRPGSWVTFSKLATRLVKLGANVNSEPGKWIGLSCTGNSGHKENPTLARAFLECGADVNALYRGRSAAHCAAQAGFVSILRILVEYRADLNQIDAFGRTPLESVELGEASKSTDAVSQFLRSNGAC